MVHLQAPLVGLRVGGGHVEQRDVALLPHHRQTEGGFKVRLVEAGESCAGVCRFELGGGQPSGGIQKGIGWSEVLSYYL